MSPIRLLLASALACASLGAAASAATIEYDFAPGSTFSIPVFKASYAVSGAFTYDTTAQTVGGVDVVFDGTNGRFTFKTGTVVSPTDLVFSDDGFNDLPELVFQNSLAQGGVDPITGGTLRSSIGTPAMASGAVSAAPESRVWALMLAGVAMIGSTLRLGRRQRGFSAA